MNGNQELKRPMNTTHEIFPPLTLETHAYPLPNSKRTKNSADFQDQEKMPTSQKDVMGTATLP